MTDTGNFEVGNMRSTELVEASKMSLRDFSPSELLYRWLILHIRSANINLILIFSFAGRLRYFAHILSLTLSRFTPRMAP